MKSNTKSFTWMVLSSSPSTSVVTKMSSRRICWNITCIVRAVGNLEKAWQRRATSFTRYLRVSKVEHGKIQNRFTSIA